MRIVIADDHALFRDSLASLLRAHDFEVVGQAADGHQAVALARDLQPDIVLMDLAMPNLDGRAATRRIVEELPEVKVVVLTASHDDEDLFEAIKAGAEGYLLKDLEADHFFSLLAGVARGEPALTPLLARKVLESLRRPTRQQDPDALTDREREVLETLVRGITTNRALAAHLGVSENTVKFHMRNIFDKLHLRNRTQAVSYALRKHLVDPPDDG